MIMSFKSLFIFALVASLGRVIAAPVASNDLGAREPCTGIWCASFILSNGHSDLSRRLASFDSNSVTLSSSSLPTEPTPVSPYNTPADPSSTLSSVDPSSTLSSVDPSSTVSSVGPSSTPSVDPSSLPSLSPSSVDPLILPSSTPSVNPSSSTPPVADGGAVTITVTSTVVLTVLPNPTQSPAPPNSVNSSSPPVGSPATLSGVLSTSSGSLDPALSQPTGFFTSSSSPAPTPSPTVIQLTNNIPASSVSSDPADQPTPTPTTGIIFLPPA
ncbi:hypothetical protein BJ322DRAFT_640574 [Thelephora terrestris]|uniref:Uncharacterized protein n=1 Tax=Thelephora terrestris TaxID=56493 RepID=A0A9P6HL67_9AGAM|nr:hypothetical protein BJ322DRAFT_640574 [Thelephora terrestris]